MTPLRGGGRRDHAMSEEFENYEDREAEARRAVERWEADGGAQENEDGRRGRDAVIPTEQERTP